MTTATEDRPTLQTPHQPGAPSGVIGEHVRGLRERKMVAHEEARKLAEEVAAENRDMTAEEKERQDKLWAEADAAEETIRRQLEAEARERAVGAEALRRRAEERRPEGLDPSMLGDLPDGPNGLGAEWRAGPRATANPEYRSAWMRSVLGRASAADRALMEEQAGPRGDDDPRQATRQIMAESPFRSAKHMREISAFGTGANVEAAVPEANFGLLHWEMRAKNAVRQAVALCTQQVGQANPMMPPSMGASIPPLGMNPIITDNDRKITGTKLDDTQKGARWTRGTKITDLDFSMPEVDLESYVYHSGLFTIDAPTERSTLPNLVMEVIPTLAAERIARIQEEEMTTADGSDKPQGLIPAIPNDMRVTTTVANGIDFEQLVEMQSKTWHQRMLGHFMDPTEAGQQVVRGNMCWMISQQALSDIRRLVDSDGRSLFVASIENGLPDRLLGDPFVINSSQPTSSSAGDGSVIHGDLSKFQLRDVRMFEIWSDRAIDLLARQLVGWIASGSNLFGTKSITKLQLT